MVVEMRGRVGEEVSKCKNTLMPSSAARRDFFQIKEFFLDDESGLSAIESVRKWTEFLCQYRMQSASGLKAFIPSFFPLLAD